MLNTNMKIYEILESVGELKGKRIDSMKMQDMMQTKDSETKSPMVPAEWDKLDDELINDENGFVRPHCDKKNKNPSKSDN